MKKYILLFCEFLFGVALFWCAVLIFSGQVSLVCRGFAIDGDGRVYIGRSNSIDIYADGEYTDSISSMTSRGYAFTIKNDTIILSTASIVYEMDFSGNILKQYDDVRSKLYHTHVNNKQFVDSSGKTYFRSSAWGRMQIVSQDGVCYQMPMLDYVLGWILALSFLGVFCTTFLLVISTRLQTDARNN